MAATIVRAGLAFSLLRNQQEPYGAQNAGENTRSPRAGTGVAANWFPPPHPVERKYNYSFDHGLSEEEPLGFRDLVGKRSAGRPAG